MSVAVEPKPEPKRLTVMYSRSAITVPIPYELLAKHSRVLKRLCISWGSSRSWCRNTPRVREEIVRVAKELGYIIGDWCRETPAGLECP